MRRTNKDFLRLFAFITLLGMCCIFFLGFAWQRPIINVDTDQDITFTDYEGSIIGEKSSISSTDDKSLFSNYTYNYFKINDTDFYINATWNKLINFTVSIVFKTNITLDSNLYNETCYGIWDFTTNSWDYSALIKITGNYSNNFNYYNDKYLNRSNTDNTTVRVQFRASKKYLDFEFNYQINVSGWFWFGSPPYNITQFEIANLYSSSFTEESTPDGLYAQWHLNENSGATASDSSGNSRDGTLINMEDGDWVSGKLNNSLRFGEGGDREYIDCGNIGSFNRLDAFSLEIWLNTTSTVWATFIGKMVDTTLRTGYELGFQSGVLRLRLINILNLNSIVVRNNKIVNDGMWHHIIATYDGSSLASGVRFYVDGALCSGNIIDHDNLNETISNGHSFWIGYRTATSYFDGGLDEVVVYSKELTASDVSQRYNSGSGTENVPSDLFTKNNQSTFRFGKNYERLINFTVDVDFKTNITIDSNEYLNNTLRIWNYGTSVWNTLTTDTTTGNYSNSFFYTSDVYLSTNSYSYCDVKIGVFTSNNGDDFLFDLFVNVSGYWTETIYPTTEYREDDIDWSNQTIDVSIATFREYYKNYTYIIRYNVDWNSVNYLVLNIGINLNRTINSTACIDEGFGIWSYTQNEWEYQPKIYNYPYDYTYTYPARTITENATYYYELFPVKSFLYKLGDGYTYIKIKFATSNLDFDYSVSFDINTIVSDYNFYL